MLRRMRMYVLETLTLKAFMNPPLSLPTYVAFVHTENIDNQVVLPAYRPTGATFDELGVESHPWLAA